MTYDKIMRSTAYALQRDGLTKEQHLARVLFLLGDEVSQTHPGLDIDRILQSNPLSRRIGPRAKRWRSGEWQHDHGNAKRDASGRRDSVRHGCDVAISDGVFYAS
jgi:hypothetical protein